MACWPGTKTMAPTLPGFKGLKKCIQFIDTHPRNPILHPSNYYFWSNIIRLTWIGCQVEDYITHNCFECSQNADDAITIYRRRYVYIIIHIYIGVSIFRKVHIYLIVSSNSIDGKIHRLYNSIKKTKSVWRYMASLALRTGAPTIHLEDNTSCIFVVESCIVTTRVNHINIRFVVYNINIPVVY